MPSAIKKSLAYDNKRACNSLDWNFILESLASHAVSEPGKLKCRSLDFMDEPGLIQLSLDETSEAKALFETGITYDVSGLSDLGGSLSRLYAKGVLNAEELLNAAKVIETSRRVKNVLLEHKEVAPNLARIAGTLFTDVDLEHEIHRCIDVQGNLTDNASPELKKLKDRYHSVHSQVHDVLENILAAKTYNEVLQEDYFTLRNGRYVVPVKIDKKGQMDGIVHDISGSGQSIFIEPKEVTHLNNTLRTTELEIEQEKYRILSTLSFRLADHTDEIADTINQLAELDLICAKARYSIALSANAPEINTKGIIELIQVRHPMLILQGEKVVPNNLAIDDTNKALIITGPNTGGKTVALKCVGVCALMVRAGLHIPAGKDSKIAIFKRIFSLIGDEQSIEESLSSFSAHVFGLRYILDNLVPDSLVLIDEICEGTDPSQGVALSKAVIEQFLKWRIRTVITTHFTELTTMGYSHEGVANASVEFDSANMEPTYRLTFGVPGKSSAFEIAQRLGLDPAVTGRAKELATGADSKIATVIENMERQSDELRIARDEALAEKQRAKEAADAQQEQLKLLKKRKSKIIEEERENIRAEFQQARAKIKQILKELREKPTHKRIAKGREQIKIVQNNLEKKMPAPKIEEEDIHFNPIQNWDGLKVGDRVYCKMVKNHGTIETLPDDKGNVRLIVAGAKLTLPKDSCSMPLGKETKKKEPKITQTIVAEFDTSDVSASREERTCDLRGMTADDAMDRVNEFLDLSVRNRYPQVFIIHGHGTGVLKREVRAYCQSSHYVKQWRPGQRGEGGDGVTVVDVEL